MAGYKKIILLSLFITLSGSAAHAQWAWFSTLKSIIAPLVTQMKEYPKLTATFTVLSLLGIHSIQYAVEHYRAQKKAAYDLAALEQQAKENEESLQELEQEKKSLDEELKNQTKENALLQERLNENQAKIAHMSQALARRSHRRLHSISQETDLKGQIELKTQERDQLKAQLRALSAQAQLIKRNPLLIAQATKNRETALAIKKRPRIDINNVLANAQGLLDENHNQYEAIKTHKEHIMFVREQLASILERMPKNGSADLYNFFNAKYQQQMRELPKKKPYQLYENLGMTQPQGILCQYQELEELIEKMKDKNTKRRLQHIFYGIQPEKSMLFNPLAKENYDAFLLGADAMIELLPTQEQYNRAQKLYEQLRSKVINIDAQLTALKKTGAHYDLKK